MSENFLKPPLKCNDEGMLGSAIVLIAPRANEQTPAFHGPVLMVRRLLQEAVFPAVLLPIFSYISGFQGLGFRV